MRRPARHQAERGATSLFIVLFSTLLFTVVTVSFISLMTSDQRRATDSEWSEGAYDSALAGVEDGKRVLSMCRLNPGSAACAAIDAERCDTIARSSLVSDTDGEVLIQSNTVGGGVSGNSVNQAYTCVIIKRDTPDYKGKLETGESTLIALNSGSESFDRLTLSWFTQEDAGLGRDASFGSLSAGPNPLPRLEDWSADGSRPPVMRAQFMQYNRSENTSLADFNESGHANTAYLYPVNGVGLSSIDVAARDSRNPSDMSRHAAKVSPAPTRCVETILNNNYACSMTLELPDMDNREAFLRLTALYEASTYKIQLQNSSGAVVNFVDAQPSIDSTGRAGDVFRRVEARVELVADVPYPRATVDINGNLCKTFSVGSDPSRYNAGDCDPSS